MQRLYRIKRLYEMQIKIQRLRKIQIKSLCEIQIKRVCEIQIQNTDTETDRYCIIGDTA